MSHSFVRSHFDKFIEFVFDANTIDSKGCVELICYGGMYDFNTRRIVKAKYDGVTYAGWFNKASKLKEYASLLHYVSGYVTVNPVDTFRLAQAENAGVKIKKGEGSTKEDILSLNFLNVDIDCERPSSSISATDEELALAVGVRDAILDNEPEIRDNCIFGCSGNGGYILMRRSEGERENDDGNARLSKEFLSYLSERYGKKGRDKAYVDVNPCFANAHLPLPGTWKCKGSDTGDRPYRLVTVDGGVIF